MAARPRLTANPAGDFQPDFSPDGSRIAFKKNGRVIDTERVTNGTAIDRIELNLALVAGANYRAVFTPDNPAAYGPSMSNTVQLP